jgi:pimeloyl-ACP methyl ester carboxylesterase
VKSGLRRRCVLAATAAMLLGSVAAQPAFADNNPANPLPGLTQGVPGLPGGLAGSGALTNVPKLPNGLPKLSPNLLADPAGSTGTDKRNFGTPTKAADKTCPYTGNVPVSIPLVNSPAGSSLPGLGGYSLSQPSIPGSVYSELCMSNESLAAAKQGNPPAVLVLVHGITYGTWYWDSPYQPQKYSVVNGLIKHGYATLNIDRIGEGRSSHPISAAVTADTNAETVHQLIQKLHAGDIGGTKFGHVGLVGHSYGSVTSWLETAKYNDADTVIGTGYGNRFKLDQGGLLFGGLIPASAQPLYQGQPWALDPGYTSFRPGVRANSPFFYKPDMDPAIFPIDEALQNPVTLEELATFVNREYDGTHKNIRTPTFIINGEHDSFFCGPQDIACTTSATHSDGPATLERLSKANTNYEAPGFSTQACLRSAIIPDAGHNLNFHLNSNQVWEQIAYFANDAMGNRGQNTATYRHQCDSKPGSLTDLLPEVGRLIPPTNLPIS